MRDLIAALVAGALIFFALSLMTSLHFYRKRRLAAQEQEAALGRTIIVELPIGADLTLFSEDAEHFYEGATPIAKNGIMAVRVLINGSPIAAFVSPKWQSAANLQATSFEDHPEGIARDRWDVALETVDGTIIVECGAIRERVSQELARKIFDAVKKDLEKRC